MPPRRRERQQRRRSCDIRALGLCREGEDAPSRKGTARQSSGKCHGAGQVASDDIGEEFEETAHEIARLGTAWARARADASSRSSIQLYLLDCCGNASRGIAALAREGSGRLSGETPPQASVCALRQQHVGKFSTGWRHHRDFFARGNWRQRPQLWVQNRYRLQVSYPPKQISHLNEPENQAA